MINNTEPSIKSRWTWGLKPPLGVLELKRERDKMKYYSEPPGFQNLTII
jgi:hypothetical protein